MRRDAKRVARGGGEAKRGCAGWVAGMQGGARALVPLYALHHVWILYNGDIFDIYACGRLTDARCVAWAGITLAQPRKRRRRSVSSQHNPLSIIIQVNNMYTGLRVI